MNIFNRLIAVFVFLVLLASAVLLALFPVMGIDLVERGLENLQSSFATIEASYAWLYVASRIVIVVLALLVFGLLLWAELRPRRPKAVRVHTEGGSQASVTTDSVARRLSWHIDQLSDVISVAPRVAAHGQSVDVVLDLQTSPEIDVPMKTDEVVSLAKEVISERMGLQVGKIVVHIEHVAYRDEA